MRAAVLAQLRGDDALADLLPGGIYDALEVGEVGRQQTPDAFDANLELQPCLLVKLASDMPAGPLNTGARLGFSLYFYQLFGADAIDAARKRVYVLLHQVRLQPASGGAWEVRHAGDTLGQYDDVLQAQLILSRYSVPIRKGDET